MFERTPSRHQQCKFIFWIDFLEAVAAFCPKSLLIHSPRAHSLKYIGRKSQFTESQGQFSCFIPLQLNSPAEVFQLFSLHLEQRLPPMLAVALHLHCPVHWSHEVSLPNAVPGVWQSQAWKSDHKKRNANCNKLELWLVVFSSFVQIPVDKEA